MVLAMKTIVRLIQQPKGQDATSLIGKKSENYSPMQDLRYCSWNTSLAFTKRVASMGGIAARMEAPSNGEGYG